MAEAAAAPMSVTVTKNCRSCGHAGSSHDAERGVPMTADERKWRSSGDCWSRGGCHTQLNDDRRSRSCGCGFNAADVESGRESERVCEDCGQRENRETQESLVETELQARLNADGYILMCASCDGPREKFMTQRRHEAESEYARARKPFLKIE